MTAPDFGGDLLAAVLSLPPRARHHRAEGPDLDALDRALDSIAAQHGDLAVSAPDFNGSVTIDCEDGTRLRFTRECRVLVAR